MKDVIYLDNAATSWPKPPAVFEAMAEFLAEDAANPGRSGHRMAVAAERAMDEVRYLINRFINGTELERIILTFNCTDSLNIALKGTLNRGDHVITTTIEHNSVSRPLQALANAGSIELTRIDPDAEGIINPADVEAAIKPSTRLIAMTHASNVTGVIQPALEVGAIARRHDLLFLLDAAQTMGVVPIDVRAMNVDLLAFPGHKSLLGPPGTGGLYVGPRAAPRPWREGGTGGDSSSPIQPDLLPYHLEGGTPNTVGIVGMGAGLRYVLERDPAKTLAHEQLLVGQVIDHLRRDERFTLYGTLDPARHVGTVSFTIRGYSAIDAGAVLDDSFHIAVRPGLHCAPYMHKVLGTFPDGTVRVSPGHFNTEQDVERLLAALDEIVG